ncbi:MAG: VOC family protein [Alphaproteobacteria bacterium]|nr:VOC family protein [Alphaproteobacteria bacterium]
MLRAAILLFALLVTPAARAAEPLIRGLDHIPIAVSDLPRAVSHFLDLGFAFKPGQRNANGIQNAHMKFPDGTELELITAAAATDELTSEYVDWLRGGDGAPFVGFYVPETTELAARISALGSPLTLDGSRATFPRSSLLHHLFFGKRQRSPTDRPEHFAHPNSAFGLIAVWLAEDALTQSLLQLMDAPPLRAQRCSPFGSSTAQADLLDGEALFVAGAAPRPILAATVAVENLEKAKRAIKTTAIALPCAPGSLWVGPDSAHGIWLEFREVKR